MRLFSLLSVIFYKKRDDIFEIENEKARGWFKAIAI